MKTSPEFKQLSKEDKASYITAILLKIGFSKEDLADYFETITNEVNGVKK